MDKKRTKVIVYLLASMIFILVGAFYVFFQGSIYKDEGRGQVFATDFTLISLPETYQETFPEEETARDKIFVYVCGCVSNPGVYELPENSRVYEALDAAGGILDDGCAKALNLAETVSDGQKIYVPSYEEYELLGSGSFMTGDSYEDEVININTADKSTLMTLPGIGESRAKAIIEYREKNGAFSSIEDIMKVPGIKEAAFEKIRDLIKVK